MFDHHFAVATLRQMTFLRASMHAAVQVLVAHLLTLDVDLLTALHRFLTATATSFPGDHHLARRTRTWQRKMKKKIEFRGSINQNSCTIALTRMTQQFAAVLASVRPFAQFATTVSYVAAIVLGILKFLAETVVVLRYLFRYILTRRTPPAALRRRTVRPFDNAIQVDDVETVGTTSRLIPCLDILTADEAFQFAGIDFPNQLFALRTRIVRVVH